MKKLPAAFWHIRQWQIWELSKRRSARKRTAPHWQPPLKASAMAIHPFLDLRIAGPELHPMPGRVKRVLRDQSGAKHSTVRIRHRTVTDPKKVRQLIDDCRRTGYSAVEDELAYGVVAVAVPVFDLRGRVVAALNSSSHSRRTTKARLVRDRLSMLRRASREISAELARVPGLSLSAEV
jgi:hypothetical protein